MNKVVFELKDINEKVYVIDEEFASSKLSVNDEFISDICEKLKIETLTQLLLRLGVNNMALVIENYTLTDTVYIEGFYNIKSDISILQVKDIKIHITGQIIQKLQADCISIFLAECDINEMQIGIFHMSESVYTVDSVEVCSVSIGKLDIYAECKRIDIQRSKIDELNNYGDMFKCSGYTVISMLHLWQNTNIAKLSIMNKIEKFYIEDSSINRLLACAKLYIDTLKVENSMIENCYGFKNKHFKNPIYESWNWIERSADNARNLSERAEANYQMAKYFYSVEKGGNKFASGLFNLCAGYGYKPLRVIGTFGALVVTNTIILTIIKIVSVLRIKTIPVNVSSFYKGYQIIWKNFCISVANLAGQIGFEMTDGLPYWISIIEYLIGVVLFAVFVNALYARYKE